MFLHLPICAFLLPKVQKQLPACIKKTYISKLANFFQILSVALAISDAIQQNVHKKHEDGTPADATPTV